ncbi:unnamed protein product [Ambrosiozyma monospora]|uniref:Unnamed protein product n=1 Tax=Ambrosiozyma monospora TaxID=43982 RepID=A0ACB5SX53_AMBMO|nr:unnamed protein product [Ambrosiozyma monospora]
MIDSSQLNQIAQGPPAFKGFLKKWTNFANGYKLRWFILDVDGRLSYYKSPNDIFNTCRGMIHLSNAELKMDSSEKSKFEIILKNKNGGSPVKWHLKANHVTETNRWVWALQTAITYQKDLERKHPVPGQKQQIQNRVAETSGNSTSTATGTGVGASQLSASSSVNHTSHSVGSGSTHSTPPPSALAPPTNSNNLPPSRSGTNSSALSVTSTDSIPSSEKSKTSIYKKPFKKVSKMARRSSQHSLLDNAKNPGLKYTNFASETHRRNASTASLVAPLSDNVGVVGAGASSTLIGATKEAYYHDSQGEEEDDDDLDDEDGDDASDDEDADVDTGAVKPNISQLIVVRNQLNMELNSFNEFLNNNDPNVSKDELVKVSQTVLKSISALIEKENDLMEKKRAKMERVFERQREISSIWEGSIRQLELEIQDREAKICTLEDKVKILKKALKTSINATDIPTIITSPPPPDASAHQKQPSNSGIDSRIGGVAATAAAVSLAASAGASRQEQAGFTFPQKQGNTIEPIAEASNETNAAIPETDKPVSKEDTNAPADTDRHARFSDEPSTVTPPTDSQKLNPLLTSRHSSDLMPTLEKVKTLDIPNNEEVVKILEEEDDSDDEFFDAEESDVDSEAEEEAQQLAAATTSVPAQSNLPPVSSPLKEEINEPAIEPVAPVAAPTDSTASTVAPAALAASAAVGVPAVVAAESDKPGKKDPIPSTSEKATVVGEESNKEIVVNGFRLKSEKQIERYQRIQSEATFKGYEDPLRTTLDKEDNRPKISLWGVLKSLVGKDMTKMTLPVSFNEPTSLLQRNTEVIEYSDLLDKAATIEDSTLRMVYVAAFAASEYVSTIGRIAKPFNPLLGETYEYARPDKGYRCFVEQVSHHPPISALLAEAPSWSYFGESNVKTKFLGRSFDIKHLGTWFCEIFPDNGATDKKGQKHDSELYTWKKCANSVVGIIIAKRLESKFSL